MRLLIDDKRDMPDGVIARDFESGKRMLILGGWSVLYIDHDLGEISNGYDLISFAQEFGYLPDKIVIVSSNPVGRQNITRVLVREGFKQLGSAFERIKEDG